MLCMNFSACFCDCLVSIVHLLCNWPVYLQFQVLGGKASGSFLGGFSPVVWTEFGQFVGRFFAQTFYQIIIGKPSKTYSKRPTNRSNFLFVLEKTPFNGTGARTRTKRGCVWADGAPWQPLLDGSHRSKRVRILTSGRRKQRSEANGHGDCFYVFQISDCKLWCSCGFISKMLV